MRVSGEGEDGSRQAWPSGAVVDRRAARQGRGRQARRRTCTDLAGRRWKKASALGMLRLTLDGKTLRTWKPLVVRESVERAGFFGRRRLIWSRRWLQ